MPPALTKEQFEDPRARRRVNWGRIIGLTVGCIIGMFPLLFFDEASKQQKKAGHTDPLTVLEEKHEAHLD